MADVTAKLQELGLTLPPAPKPVAAYIPAVQTGSLLIISGQLPFVDGKLLATGKVPVAVSVTEAQQLARQCILNGLAIVGNHLQGDWSKLSRVVRIGVFVQSCDEFYEQPQVGNGASELLVQIFGDAGRHARAAVGVNALPLNAPVEVEMMFELKS